MRTNRSNIRFLRSGLIGSMSAWFPSRRSTAHQRGALEIVFVGQVRPGRCTLIWSWKGTYFATGIPDGCWGWIIVSPYVLLLSVAQPRQRRLRDEGRLIGQ